MGRSNVKLGATAAASVAGTECCMCGDYGLSSQLFKCKQCRFRSQHKYCSNLYPEEETYHICNWCLSQNEDRKRWEEKNIEKTSPNYQYNDTKMNKNNKRVILLRDNQGGLKDKKTSRDQIKIKTDESRADQSGPSTGRIGKRIIRRTRSEEISNGGKKQVFRNKVRRYKLLDEVSC
ncbi:hypothetical protein CASFOL_021434 [Castilleja foliolosa]|uniref:PHD-type zinc finger plants domain-containing protein n=1 Tax=Castilleja foliolosa TaxID=1961234 RepID=A0ABD3CWJ2_9LAMI